jgi:large subunit ribosomal protein L31
MVRRFVDTEQETADVKKDTHPEYGEATITCACGNVISTRSTVKEMHVNTCSSCHPFYTGQATFIDTEGRVEQFKRRYGRK